jgi:hypothetical protein
MLLLASRLRYLEMEAASSCKMIVTYHNTRRHIQEHCKDVAIKQRPILVIEMQRLFCEVRTEFLCLVWQTWGSHVCEYGDYVLLGCDAEYPGRFSPTLWRKKDGWSRTRRKPITVSARSKEWIVSVPSKTGIVDSNPTQGMDVCVRLFCVCAVLCAGNGLETGWSPV